MDTITSTPTTSLTSLVEQFGCESTTTVTYGWMGVMTKVATGELWATSNSGRWASAEEANVFRADPANSFMFHSESESGEYTFSYHLTTTTQVTASTKVALV